MIINLFYTIVGTDYKSAPAVNNIVDTDYKSAPAVKNARYPISHKNASPLYIATPVAKGNMTYLFLV